MIVSDGALVTVGDDGDSSDGALVTLSDGYGNGPLVTVGGFGNSGWLWS